MRKKRYFCSYNQSPMEAPKVSVIIPVYNTQEYVRQAVQSILAQTLKELEVIVVDDGSTDNSLGILTQLSSKDSRVHVYHQANRGQSVARNVALTHATGKYIYFMDSDDLLEADALEQCYHKCEAQALDLIFFNADILNKDQHSSMALSYNHGQWLDEQHVERGIVVLDNQLRENHFTPSPCLFFIRAALLRERNIGFYPGIIHEDQLFAVRLFLAATRVMYINRAFFHRRLRSDSTMTTRFAWRNMRGYLTVTRELCRLSRRHPNTDTQAVIDRHLRQMLDAAVWEAHVLPWRQRMRLLYICLTRYNKYVSKRTLTVLVVKSMIPNGK